MHHAGTIITSFALLLQMSPLVCGAASDSFDAWIGRALLNAPAASAPALAGLELVRQDHAELMSRQSVMKTPLKIGDASYAHGLGTHAVSEIVVRLDKPGKLFTAQVGVDNNYDTAGRHGSVVFAVEIEGREVFKSEICRGGQPAVPVRLPLNGARQFTLRVLDGGDGVFYDQADWADAAVVDETGGPVWLDELSIVAPPAGFAERVPFSFDLGGEPAQKLLSRCKRASVRLPEAPGRSAHSITWTDPATGLELRCVLTQFTDRSAAEWVLHLRNTGSADTPIIENLRPLDLAVLTPSAAGEVILHRAFGSTCAETDFLPVDEPMRTHSEAVLVPNGGRSSDGVMPFFNLQWADGGVVAAIGWSGQWTARIQRNARQLTLQAGQQFARFKLHPGERVRTPRILLIGWSGSDHYAGQNQLRRLMLEQYTPRVHGELVLPPVTHNTWFAFNEGNQVDEANQLAFIRAIAPTGVEYFWLDAGWFEGGWPAGAGSWVPRKEAFPRGLKPLGDAAHAAGMKFVVWFEPERVNPSSRIAREHAEWVLHAGAGDGLFNLGDPAARAWLTESLSKCIGEWGIDVFRNDFNIDPLRFWQQADEPDRQGLTEIRYIEGLYAMWDDLRARHPGMFIDNCASGGRRIDLETMSRSIPLWRSDTQCVARPLPVQDQVQTAGLSLWVPLHSAGVWSLEPYAMHSVAATGMNLGRDARAADYPVQSARRAIDEVKRLRPMWLGDFYPLLEVTLDQRHWCAWQLDRPDRRAGCVMLFRRERSPYASVDLELRNIETQRGYLVRTDGGQAQPITGEQLRHLHARIEIAPGFTLLEYEAVP